MENALDPSHLQFVHEGQQGKRIGPRKNNYPGASTPKFQKIRRGYKARITDPTTTSNTDYEILLYFPFYTAAHLNQGGVSVLICSWIVPLSKNKSRILFRFYRSFAKFLPEVFFQSANDIIARQEQVVLTGQQMRVEQGASAWNITVKADALSYEYRKYWEKVSASQKIWFKNWESTQSRPSVCLVTLPDIEDLGRAQIHPCVNAPIEVQEDYATKATKLYPTLWPAQYKAPPHRFRHYTLIATSLTAVALGYFVRSQLNS